MEKIEELELIEQELHTVYRIQGYKDTNIFIILTGIYKLECYNIMDINLVFPASKGLSVSLDCSYYTSVLIS